MEKCILQTNGFLFRKSNNYLIITRVYLSHIIFQLDILRSRRTSTKRPQNAQSTCTTNPELRLSFLPWHNKKSGIIWWWWEFGKSCPVLSKNFVLLPRMSVLQKPSINLIRSNYENGISYRNWAIAGVL